jgi:sugar/nucleoside kinase (ribokinase family)
VTLKKLDVLCVSDLCVDLLVAGKARPRFGQAEQWVDDYTLELGGSANIFASQFAKLGGQVGVAGRLGSDSLAGFVARSLKDCGIDSSRVRKTPGLKTGLGVALTARNDRAILTYAGSIDATDPSSLDPAWLSQCRHWHVAAYFLLNKLKRTWPAWLARCHRAGVTTSLDTNWDPEERWDGVRELLPLVDLFFPNEAEALAISGKKDLEKAGQSLASSGTMVVIKRGNKGSVVFRRDAAPVRFPGQALKRKVVDSVGAGDNFDAGFLRAWLKGRDLKACLALGDRCGRASLAAAGGIRGQLRGKVA